MIGARGGTVGRLTNATLAGLAARHGTPLLDFISPTGESWDLAVIARFPTAGAFVELVTGTCYQAVSRHRRAALLDSRLIVTQARGVF